MGVATRNLKRQRCGWLAGQADSGRCNRVGWYEGLPLLTAVSPTGAITGYGIAPARTKDQRLAETFLALRHDPQPGLPRSARLPAACLWWMRVVKAKHWPQRWTPCYGATVIAKPKRSAPDYRPPYTVWNCPSSSRITSEAL
jgi:hypothetical protein